MILCYFVSMIGNFDHSLANPIWPSSMTFLPSPLHTLTPHSLTQSSFDLFPNILFFCAIGKFSPPHIPHKRYLTPVIHSLPCIHWPHALLPPGSSQEWIPLGIHCKTRGGRPASVKQEHLEIFSFWVFLNIYHFNKNIYKSRDQLIYFNIIRYQFNKYIISTDAIFDPQTSANFLQS